jgi:hypothetical protein
MMVSKDIHTDSQLCRAKYRKTAHAGCLLISLSGDGGNLSAGIEIGTRIRLRGYRTVVAG